MSLYHETADILSAPASHGGSLKNRVFAKKGLKSPAAQIYALAVETCKWSEILKEVVENAQLLKHERKLTPILSLLLVHDFLLSKGGIALPQSHGLRASVDRHRARLSSEFTRSRLRRKMPSVEALRAQIDLDADPEGGHPRWVRINAIKTDLQDELETTFKSFQRAMSIDEVVSGPKRLYIDEHVPNLVAISPGTDLTKTDAYAKGHVILQDKASCFPAYLLDPHADTGDVIDSCAAPGNKTTHLAAIMASHAPEATLAAEDQSSSSSSSPTVFAFERDDKRAKTLEKMVRIAGGKQMTKIGLGQDFLQVKPEAAAYRSVGALLLDPSCSGSGIVGRDSTPTLHLPEASPSSSGAKSKPNPPKPQQQQQQQDTSSKKRKRGTTPSEPSILIDDDGNTTTLTSEQDLQKRLQALLGFQLVLLLHAMKFPAARKITYSTCSIHAEENEHVVLKALQSDVAKQKGWRIKKRQDQVRGMREWPVRGVPEACRGVGGDGRGAEGEEGRLDEVAEACIRTYKGDGRGVMGFFVAAFERDPTAEGAGEGGESSEEGSLLTSEDGPYVRDDEGVIVRDVMGMPVLKSTGQPVSLEEKAQRPAAAEADDGSSEMDYGEEASEDEDDDDGDEESSGSEGWNGFD